MEPRKVSGSIGTALAVATGIAGLFGGELTAIPWLRALLVAVAVVSILHVLALLPPISYALNRLNRIRPMWAASAVVGVVSGIAAGFAGGYAHWRLVRPNTKTSSHVVVTDSGSKPNPAPVADSAPTKPAVTASTEGPYVVVRNSGAPEAFRARLLATHAQEVPSVTVGSHFEGIWMTTWTDKSEIATGDADRLMLGAVSGDHDPEVTPFHSYDAATGKIGVRTARQLPDKPVPALPLDLILVSLPAMAGGPKTYELIVWQGGEVGFLTEKPF